MTRVIASAGAVLVAAVVLAGCGGGSANGTSASGSAAATTSGVAGAQTTKVSGSASFDAQVRGFEQQLQKAVTQFRNGNLAGAAGSGSGLLTNCEQNVDKLAAHARSHPQHSSVAHLRSACASMTEAAREGAAGHMQHARSLAGDALAQAKLAVKQLHR